MLIMVQQNIVFNNTDTTHLGDHTVIPGDALAEEERDKIVQNSTPDTHLSKLTDENPTKLCQPIPEPITYESTPDPQTPVNLMYLKETQTLCQIQAEVTNPDTHQATMQG